MNAPSRLVLVLLASVTLQARLVHAKDPAPHARIELGTALELANAARWTESLAVLDRIVTAEPAWAEAYFVRAGVLANLAGDASTLENLGNLDRSVDYGTLASELERSSKDLGSYLAIEPAADNHDQVVAAISALDARALVARADERAVAGQLAAEARALIVASDVALERFAPLAMNELTRGHRFGLELTGASMAVPTGGIDGNPTLLATAILPRAAWAIAPAVKLTAELPAYAGNYINTNANSQISAYDLGNLILGGGWLRDLDLAGERARFGVGSRISLDTGTNHTFGQPAAVQAGLTDPLAFEHGVAVELHADLRILHDRRFVQAELASAYLSPITGATLAARVALGGGIRVGARGALLATLTAATATGATASLGSDSLASDLRIAVSTGSISLGVAVPISGQQTALRGYMLTATVGGAIH